jgi:hypothetical protein
MKLNFTHQERNKLRKLSMAENVSCYIVPAKCRLLTRDDPAAEDSRHGCNINTWPHDKTADNHLPDFFEQLKTDWYIPLPEIYGMHAGDGAKRIKPANWEAKLKGAVVRVEFELYFRKLAGAGKNVFSPKLTLVQVLQEPFKPAADMGDALDGPKGKESPKKKRRIN